jgi:hypothetical protein
MTVELSSTLTAIRGARCVGLRLSFQAYVWFDMGSDLRLRR